MISALKFKNGVYNMGVELSYVQDMNSGIYYTMGRSFLLGVNCMF